MKKFLLVIVLITIFIACGEEKIKNYSREEKINLITEMIVNKDKKAEKEYNNILEQLRKKADKGDNEAEKEKMEWVSIKAKISINHDYYKSGNEEGTGAIKMLKGE